MAHDKWMPSFVPAPTPTPTSEKRQTRTYATGDALPPELLESLNEAELTERAQIFETIATQIFDECPNEAPKKIRPT